VLDLAKRSETAIYAIGLRSTDITESKGFKEAEFALRQFAQETGGAPSSPIRCSISRRSTAKFRTSCRVSITVGYTSRNPRRDGGWRRVVVRINGRQLTPRTKLGYFAPTAR
jgi:hypothetical protein